MDQITLVLEIADGSKEEIIISLAQEELYLHRKKIVNLPESIGNLQQLQDLYLSNNSLTALPDSIGNLHQLRDLDLSNNNLTALPESICNLQQLRYLYLIGNPINEEEKNRINSLLPNCNIYF